MASIVFYILHLCPGDMLCSRNHSRNSFEYFARCLYIFGKDFEAKMSHYLEQINDWLFGKKVCLSVDSFVN